MKKIFFKIPVLLMLICISYKASSQSQFTSKIIGVGVVVSDINKSLDFYINGIGMVKTGEFTAAEDFAKRSGLTNGVPFSVTVLKLENSPDANEWKLMSFQKKASHPKQTYIHDDVGMQYITIMVASLKTAMEKLTKMKVPFLGNSPVALDANRQLLLVQDPDGNFVELIGPM